MTDRCTDYKPDHNGECLNCDDWAGEHDLDFLATTAIALGCTGVTETCPVVECMACSIRDCPHHEPLHYHHDGCPQCEPA